MRADKAFRGLPAPALLPPLGMVISSSLKKSFDKGQKFTLNAERAEKPHSTRGFTPHRLKIVTLFGVKPRVALATQGLQVVAVVCSTVGEPYQVMHRVGRGQFSYALAHFTQRVL